MACVVELLGAVKYSVSNTGLVTLCIINKTIDHIACYKYLPIKCVRCHSKTTDYLRLQLLVASNATSPRGREEAWRASMLMAKKKKKNVRRNQPARLCRQPMSCGIARLYLSRRTISEELAAKRIAFGTPARVGPRLLS